MAVYHEGPAVEPILRALDAAVSNPHEILVVYDTDDDPTVPVIERLSRELPAIGGHRNDLGRGVLNALRAHGPGHDRRASGRRGADDLARPDERHEQLQAPAVAPALPSLVPAGAPLPATAPPSAGSARLTGQTTGASAASSTVNQFTFTTGDPNSIVTTATA